MSTPTRRTSTPDQLVLETHWIVPVLAWKLFKRLPPRATITYDELISAGNEALVRASRSFDSKHGVPFQAYAELRIRGALMDELRRFNPLRASTQRYRNEIERLTDQLGRTPTTQELMVALNLTAPQLAEHLATIKRSRQGPLEDAAIPDTRAPGPEAILLRREQIGYLHAAIRALPPVLQYVITERFFAERMVRDIADEQGVTHSCVSKRIAEALRLLQDAMNEHLDSPVSTDGLSQILIDRRAQFLNTAAGPSGIKGFKERLAHTHPDGLPRRT